MNRAAIFLLGVSSLDTYHPNPLITHDVNLLSVDHLVREGIQSSYLMFTKLGYIIIRKPFTNRMNRLHPRSIHQIRHNRLMRRRGIPSGLKRVTVRNSTIHYPIIRPSIQQYAVPEEWTRILTFDCLDSHNIRFRCCWVQDNICIYI